MLCWYCVGTFECFKKDQKTIWLTNPSDFVIPLDDNTLMFSLSFMMKRKIQYHIIMQVVKR